MPIESAFNYISDLNASYPNGATDQVSTVDDHLNGIKAVLKNQFFNLGNKVVNATAQQLNNVAFALTDKIVFAQVAAPTGWVQDLSFNDRALRVVNTPGGGIAGSYSLGSVDVTHSHGNAAATGDHLLTAAQSGLPAHVHPVLPAGVTGLAGSGGSTTTGGTQAQSVISTGNNATQDASAPHNHSLTDTDPANPAFSLRYLDVIVCRPASIT